jgi:hypothetical protein
VQLVIREVVGSQVYHVTDSGRSESNWGGWEIQVNWVCHRNVTCDSFSLSFRGEQDLLTDKNGSPVGQVCHDNGILVYDTFFVIVGNHAELSSGYICWDIYSGVSVDNIHVCKSQSSPDM